MLIPIENLTPEALTAVLEDIVTRDGTDYGQQELGMTDKLDRLKSLISSGQAYLIFDEVSESVSCVTKEQAKERGFL